MYTGIDEYGYGFISSDPAFNGPLLPFWIDVEGDARMEEYTEEDTEEDSIAGDEEWDMD